MAPAELWGGSRVPFGGPHVEEGEPQSRTWLSPTLTNPENK